VPLQLPPIIAERLEQLTFKQKAGLAGAGLILMAAAAVFFLFLPRWETASLLKKDIEQEKGKLQEIQGTQARIARFKEELAEMEIQYKQLESMLPESSEMPHLLKTVSDLGQEQGLEFLLFKPGKETPKDMVVEIPVDLNFRGTFHQVEVFFERLRRYPRILNIRQIDVGSWEEKTGRINVRCQLLTFRMQPYTPPPPEAVKAEKTEKKK
jgi:type IV pilus assembly protein PilO